MVRSNSDQCVGFLSDARRLNVSITRAKRCLVVIGDGTTLSSDALLGTYVEWLYDNAEMLSPDELE